MNNIVPVEPTELTPSQIIKKASDSLATIAIELSEVLRQDLKPNELAQFHDWTHSATRSMEAFKEIANSRLKKLVEAKGEQVTDKGTKELDLGNGRVQRITPNSTLPDDKLTEKVLSGAGLDITVHMDPTIKYKANESKLDALVKGGKLTAEQKQKCYKPTTYKMGKSGVKGEIDEE